MPELIITAFAVNGDKTAPPSLSPTNFVSFQQGYTTDYELALRADNPNAKAVERPIQNYLFNITTDNISFWQRHAYAQWYATMPGGYNLNDKVVRQNDAGDWLPYRSLVEANITDPLTNSVNWEFDYSVTDINTGIPMPSGGAIGSATSLISSPINLNIVTQGTYEIASDTVAAACSNIPVQVGGTAVSGMLECIQWVFSGSSYTVQRFTGRNGFSASRGAINGSFSAWTNTASSYGRSDGTILIGTSTILTGLAGGNSIIWTGNGGTITLPIKSALIPNQFIWIYNRGSTAINIATQNPDLIDTNAGNLNSINLQVGDSLQITVLSAANSYQLIGGTVSLQFSSSLSSQPPIGDNSQRIATTAFVQNTVGNANHVFTFSANATMNIQHIGSLCIFNPGTYTIVLPNPALVPGGIIRTIVNGAGSITLSAFAGTFVIVPNVSSATHQNVYSGEVRELFSDGINWFLTPSTVVINYPIGIAIFFAQNKNPNTLFPGTSWVYTGENRTIRTGLANGSDVLTTGGSDTATLGAGNLPNHVHGISAHIGFVGTAGDLGALNLPNINTYPIGIVDFTLNTNTSATGSSAPFSVANSFIKLMCWYRTA